MSQSSNTLFVGKVLLAFEVLESTNKAAEELIKKKEHIAEGTCINAAFQTSGKGQRGNTWESEAGQNLLLSIILRPRFLAPKQQFLLNQISSLALVDVISSLGIDQCLIKWPNDIYVNQDKIAGILIQNLLKGQQIEYSILGIGLNVNQVFFSEGIPNPISVRKLLGNAVNLNQLRQQLFSAIEKRYLQAKNNLAPLIEEYEELLYAKDQIRNFLDCSSEKVFTGVVRGVDDLGKIKIESGNEMKFFDFKEVKFL